MADKPTLKEYLKYHNGRYAKTDDGRYYTITTFPKNFIIMMVLVVLLAAPFLLVMFSDIPWRLEIAKDLTILYLIAVLFVPAIFYPFERFERIEEASEQYQKVLTRLNMRFNRIITLILAAFMALIFSLNSYSLAYLRSVLDTPEAEMWIHMDEVDDSIELNTDDGDTIIIVPGGLSGEATIHLYMWHTPVTPRLALDGEDFEPYDSYQSSPFWFDQHYFHQDCDYTINAESIHDGSVLTLTCGKWQYEWVFDIQS